MVEEYHYIINDQAGILIFNGHGFTIYQPELMTVNQFLFNARIFLSYGSAVHYMRKYMSYQHREGSRIVKEDELLLVIAERKLDGTL